jgi:hypothetical protein
MAAQVLNFTSRMDEISIREASAADRTALQRLAALDSQPELRGRVLVAEIDGEIEAAVSIESGRTVADPFRRTLEAMALLETRAEQLRRPRHSSAWQRLPLANARVRAA